MSEAPVISGGMDQRIGALVVELTTAKNIPDWLNATYRLAADADSHVNVYLREIDTGSPTLLNVKRDLQDELDIARENEPDEGAEDHEHWVDYVEEHEYQLEHVVEMWGARVGYKVFVEKWDEMYGEWCNIVGAMSMMVEGGMVSVFDTRRTVRQDVNLPVDPATRDMMLVVMGVRDIGQEDVTRRVAVARGVGELDRRMFAAASKFSAVFAEIFGDLSVYRDNYYQHLSLKRAEDKGRLEEVLKEREMRYGGSEY
jgi:hypothetical protein